MAKILIVDDEPDILLLLRLNLSAEGYDVVLAADGEKALERIASDQPDLVVLDVMMPVMDGWGVLDALPRLAHPPRVIVVSAKSSDRDITRAIESGAVDYLTKPFSPAELGVLVQQVVALSPDELDAHRKARLAR